MQVIKLVQLRQQGDLNTHQPPFRTVNSQRIHLLASLAALHPNREVKRNQVPRCNNNRVQLDWLLVQNSCC